MTAYYASLKRSQRFADQTGRK
jgi:hypothetical protein